MRVGPRLLFGTAGSAAFGAAMREAVRETIGRLDPPPEHDFADYLQYLRVLASYAWSHPHGESLGLVTVGYVGYDSSAGRVRALSTDHNCAFEWAEDPRLNPQIHWLGPTEDVRQVVQGWYDSNEIAIRRGPVDALAAVQELFETVAACDSTVNTQVTAEIITAPELML